MDDSVIPPNRSAAVSDHRETTTLQTEWINCPAATSPRRLLDSCNPPPLDHNMTKEKFRELYMPGIAKIPSSMTQIALCYSILHRRFEIKLPALTSDPKYREKYQEAKLLRILVLEKRLRAVLELLENRRDLVEPEEDGLVDDEVKRIQYTLDRLERLKGCQEPAESKFHSHTSYQFIQLYIHNEFDPDQWDIQLQELKKTFQQEIRVKYDEADDRLDRDEYPTLEECGSPQTFAWSMNRHEIGATKGFWGKRVQGNDTDPHHWLNTWEKEIRDERLSENTWSKYNSLAGTLHDIEKSGRKKGNAKADIQKACKDRARSEPGFDDPELGSDWHARDGGTFKAKNPCRWCQTVYAGIKVDRNLDQEYSEQWPTANHVNRGCACAEAELDQRQRPTPA